MIKLVDLLNEVVLLEYNKSHLDYVAVKLNVKDRETQLFKKIELDEEGFNNFLHQNTLFDLDDMY